MRVEVKRTGLYVPHEGQTRELPLGACDLDDTVAERLVRLGFASPVISNDEPEPVAPRRSRRAKAAD